MRAATLSLSSPVVPKTAAFLLAGALLFAAGAAHAAPMHHQWQGDGHHTAPQERHDDHGRDQRNWQNHARNDRHGWGHDRHESSFSFSYFFAPEPAYYPQPYYAPQPVYPEPVAYQPSLPYNTPLPAADDGRYCREYTKDVIVGNRVQSSYGTACMQPDGSWEIQS